MDLIPPNRRFASATRVVALWLAMGGMHIQSSSAADAIWKGGAGLWRNPSLWSTGVEPTQDTNVLIDGGKLAVASTVTGDIFPKCHDLTIDSGDTVVIPLSGTLRMTGNVNVNGLIQVEGAPAMGFSTGALVFEGSGDQTLEGNGRIELGVNGTTIGGGGFIGNNSGGVLTIGAGIQISGFGAMHTFTSIVNRGSISVDVPGSLTQLSYLTNQGVLEAKQGAKLLVSGGGDHTGTIRVASGGLVQLAGLSSVNGIKFTNNLGQIQISDGGELKFQGGYNDASGVIAVDGGMLTIPSSPASHWQNRGNISLHNFVLNLQDSLVPEDLGAIVRSGTGMTNLSATLNNTGHVLDLNGPADSWTLKGGTLRGGAVSAKNGAQFLSQGGSLDAVVVNAFVGMTPFTGTVMTGDRKLTIRNGVILNNGAIEVAADVGHSASLVFTGMNVQTVDGNGQIILGPAGANLVTITREYQQIENAPPIPLPVGDVTFGPGILVHAGTGSIGVDADGRFFNLGTIVADTAGGVLNIANLTNHGTIQANQSATINLLPGFVQTDGKLMVDGVVALSAPGAIGGIIAGSGLINGSMSVEGTIAPGGSAGQEVGVLSVDGNLTFAPEARLKVQVGATVADLLKVMGNLDLSGLGDSVEIAHAGVLQPGSSFLIASYTGSLSGEFDRVSDGFVASYSTPHEVRITAVPDPSSCAIGSTLTALALCRRRRQ